MSPEEKAEDLINDFLEVTYYVSIAKKCALIAVDEILKSHYKVLTGIKQSTLNYYNEVKQEIEKL